jgi:hypothetical protein
MTVWVGIGALAICDTVRILRSRLSQGDVSFGSNGNSHDECGSFFRWTGERWRDHRKMFHRQFQQSVAPIHRPVQLKSAHGLLRLLLEKPKDLINHLRQ